MTTSPDVSHAHRLLAPWYVDGGRDDLTAHRRRHGPLPAPDVRTLVDSIAAAGLRGRGGAGFPTAAKVRAVAASRSQRVRRRAPVVVANGCEGEPASRKDSVLLLHSPHLVLDGVAVAARALGATDAYLCVHADDPGLDALQAQVANRDDAVPVHVVAVPARYVASEESALVQYLSGGPALPTTTPPRPAERGVGGRPTLVDNVETLADLALIAHHGPEWFRRTGTADLPGTLLVTTGGALRSPGVDEVCAGTTVRDALDLAGGPTEPVHAILSGGYGGAWLGLDALDTPLDHGPMRAAGSVLGVPVLLALPTRVCGLAQTAHLLDHLARESAGQCGPCTFGLPAVADDLAALVRGGPDAPDAHSRLVRRLGVIAGRGACSHPDGAVRLTRSALRVFRSDVDDHVRGRPCAGAAAPSAFPLPWTGR
ncbi:NADH-ubiquinone oxidoreductase-F iron-sulfur binding region domain-containing protein [Pseudonocardia sp. N23]|uniref:NADH-ubiquinone oxidoreductase-F iron-sulfur binding region domain-containing protein n=1 Tax=Pseudonocardia sp. N23 TaxID=1987376 RepID=UPI000BFB4F36|nr:NADH-ubiquinone oxidoreductase-F iron-sulfur binding region domain-containing protein [Pseudonocardia sp. N23]GAY08352.1 putative Fe-S, FMN containing oxidoreductase [Pseudonocardia sp. N23]